jgi:hypothetical protein
MVSRVQESAMKTAQNKTKKKGQEHQFHISWNNVSREKSEEPGIKPETTS